MDGLVGGMPPAGSKAIASSPLRTGGVIRFRTLGKYPTVMTVSFALRCGWDAWSVIVVDAGLIFLAAVGGIKSVDHVICLGCMFKVGGSSGPPEASPVFRWARGRSLVVRTAVNLLYRGPALTLFTGFLLLWGAPHASKVAIWIGVLALLIQLVLQLSFIVAGPIAVAFGRTDDPIRAAGLVIQRTEGTRAVGFEASLLLMIQVTVVVVGFAAVVRAVDVIEPAAFNSLNGRPLGVIDALFFSLCTLVTLGDSTVTPVKSIAKMCVIGELVCGVGLLPLVAATCFRYLGAGATSSGVE
jgi:hypothetical protein